MTKLTLTISDPSIIEEAKVPARETGRSLSALVENYLKQISRKSKEPEQDDEEISPLVRSLRGMVDVPENWNEKEELYRALSEKYLSV